MADIALKSGEIPLGSMLTISAMFLLAFGIKAAAFPGNAWLPASYHTPSVAVSALFGGLLTKVGAYAVLRVLLAMLPEGRDALEPVIAVVAVATMVLAPLGALAQTNLRRAVGFLVIGGIGVIFAGLAFGTLRGVAGSTLYAVHSMLTLTAFYLAAGLIERMNGTNDIRFMGGTYSAGAPLSILFIVLVFAVSGLPPFLGFWPKILLIEAGAMENDWFVVAGVLLNAFLTLIAASRLWAHIFWRVGQEGEHSEQPNSGIRRLDATETRLGLAPTVALVALIVVLGLFPNWLFEAGRIGAFDLIEPQRYIDAVFSEVQP